MTGIKNDPDNQLDQPLLINVTELNHSDASVTSPNNVSHLTIPLSPTSQRMRSDDDRPAMLSP
jgi:hypothetical protein